MSTEITNVVATIPVAWDADGNPQHYLIDSDDAGLVVEALSKAGLLRGDRNDPAELWCPSVDVCGFCGDSECDGISCISGLNPDDPEPGDYDTINQLHGWLRRGRLAEQVERCLAEAENRPVHMSWRTSLYGRRVEKMQHIGQTRGGEYTEGWNALMAVLTRPGSDV